MRFRAQERCILKRVLLTICQSLLTEYFIIYKPETIREMAEQYLKEGKITRHVCNRFNGFHQAIIPPTTADNAEFVTFAFLGKAVIAASPASRTLWYEIDVAAASENRPAPAKVKNSNTDWMAGKVLAFMHYLPKEEERDMVDGFDAVGLVRQLVDTGVDGCKDGVDATILVEGMEHASQRRGAEAKLRHLDSCFS